MTTETVLPELVGSLAVLPESLKRVIQAYGAACARTALQSPEVQQMRKDADRYRWLRRHWHELAESYTDDTSRVISKMRLYQDDNWPPIDAESLDSAIDAAMEQTG